VFLRDRVSNTTKLVSISASGFSAGNGNSLPVSISTNGQFVLFESSASNLIDGDTNNSPDLFVRDVISNATFLVSAPISGKTAGGVSRAGAMTPDGRYVAFLSGATNLVLNDTNGIPDVFVRDLQSNTTDLVSVGAKSRSSTVSTLVLASESAPDISQDGRFVLFSSTAINLVQGVIPLSTSGNEIYLRDRQAGTNIWISGGARPIALGTLGTSNVLYFNFLISADGQFVVYQARKSTASTGLTLHYSAFSGITQVIHTNALVTSTGDSRTVQMSPDGRFVTFVASQGVNLGTNTYVLLWDNQTGLNTIVSGDAAGSVPPGSTCDWPTVTPDGRFVARGQETREAGRVRHESDRGH
jgi:Tol biopolymer transport system component